MVAVDVDVPSAGIEAGETSISIPTFSLTKLTSTVATLLPAFPVTVTGPHSVEDVSIASADSFPAGITIFFILPDVVSISTSRSFFCVFSLPKVFTNVTFIGRVDSPLHGILVCFGMSCIFSLVHKNIPIIARIRIKRAAMINPNGIPGVPGDTGVTVPVAVPVGGVIVSLTMPLPSP